MPKKGTPSDREGTVRPEGHRQTGRAPSDREDTVRPGGHRQTKRSWPLVISNNGYFCSPNMKKFHLSSAFLNREVTLEAIGSDEAWAQLKKGRLLLVNDGQDLASMELEKSLADLQRKYPDTPLAAVGIHVGERKQEFGISQRPDFAQRGSRAAEYGKFVTEELLPYLRRQKGEIPDVPERQAVMGFSLGALSAFDLAWHNSHHFGTAGLFSGSFWWRSKGLEDGYQASDRIALQLVNETDVAPKLRLWFQTGGADESADRDNDGLIDSIGDTLDLMRALQQKGYVPGNEMEYVEMGNGRHDHKTMARIIPRFLDWWMKS